MSQEEREELEFKRQEEIAIQRSIEDMKKQEAKELKEKQEKEKEERRQRELNKNNFSTGFDHGFGRFDTHSQGRKTESSNVQQQQPARNEEFKFDFSQHNANQSNNANDFDFSNYGNNEPENLSGKKKAE